MFAFLGCKENLFRNSRSRKHAQKAENLSLIQTIINARVKAGAWWHNAFRMKWKSLCQSQLASKAGTCRWEQSTSMLAQTQKQYFFISFIFSSPFPWNIYYSVQAYSCTTWQPLKIRTVLMPLYLEIVIPGYSFLSALMEAEEHRQIH